MSLLPSIVSIAFSPSGHPFASVSSPHLADRVVILVSAGVLLLIVECLRPGLVLPGATGLLLLLLAIHSVLKLPLRPLALTLLGASILLLAVTAARRLWLVGGLLGTLALSAALLLLVAPHRDAVQVSRPLAIVAALLLGPLSTLLLRVAIVARRAKRSPSRPAASARVD